jgi:hypothetical protein
MGTPLHKPMGIQKCCGVIMGYEIDEFHALVEAGEAARREV